MRRIAGLEMLRDELTFCAIRGHTGFIKRRLNMTFNNDDGLRWLLYRTTLADRV